MKLVLDVSNNDTIDWHHLDLAKPDGLICKVSEGSWLDRTYSTHKETANSLRIPFGGYLFLRPNSSTNQAEFFLNHANLKKGDIQPIIDSEVTDGLGMRATAQRVNSCAMALESEGYKPILYASTYFWFGLFRALPKLNRLPVWEADYPGHFTRWFPWLAQKRIKLRNGASVVLWQWTDEYAVGDKSYDASRLFVPIKSLLIT